jgi:chorismate lyase/3-hydroxybenzoate synthase
MTVFQPNKPLKRTVLFRPAAGGPASQPPGWLTSAFRSAASELVPKNGEGLELRVVEQPEMSLCSCRVPGASRMSAELLRSATRQAYLEVCRALSASSAGHMVRLWNFIPGIHAGMGNGLDRYRVFNQGRYEALAEWFGGEEAFGRSLATATGVGHSGRDLLIHALASTAAGTPVENPRQYPAYRYSARYGPRPPAFARATVASLPMFGRVVLVGGTASVLREDSVHHGDLAAQLEETFTNLGALLEAAAAVTGPAPFSRFIHLRAYFLKGEDEAQVRSAMVERVPRGCAVELVRANLCRPELLVEVEGVATLHP